jgi:hypothetical protein
MADVSIEEARVAGQRLKERLGLSDEEFDRHLSHAFNRRMMVAFKDMVKYKIIAEVVESKFCGAGCKVGSKLVFQCAPNVLLPEESDCGLCVKAIGPVSDLMHGIWDRMSEGLDPNEGIGEYASCLDLGLEYGGLGNVKFRVYAEKME